MPSTTPRPRLRAYIAAVVLATLALAWWQVARAPAGWWRADAPAVTLAAALTVAAECTAIAGRGRVAQSLATVLHVAAVLVLPAPLPLLIAAAGAAASQVLSPGRAPHKRVFNVAHTTLTVGACGAIVAAVGAACAGFPPFASLAGSLAAAAAILAYYALDEGLVVCYLGIADGVAPWRLWWGDKRPVALPGLAAAGLGAMAASLWAHTPALVPVIILPIAALRGAFLALHHTEERAIALRDVLKVATHIRLDDSPEALAQSAAEAAAAIAGAASAAAYLPDPDVPGRFQRVAVAPADAADYGPMHLPAPPRGAGAVSYRLAHGGDDAAALVVPLALADGQAVGLLHLLRPSLSADNRDAFATLSTVEAIALENAHLHAQAVARASEDSLTALLNHRAFQDRAAQEVARARRGGHSLAVVMIDLDGFGAVNNEHGHQAGDVTLLAVARCLREQTRQADVAARYGGDEFAVLLPETELDEALETAERIRAELARLTVAHGPRAIRVTASVGVASLPGHADNREDLIGAADRASYAAKRAGKNRVRQAEAGALPHDPVALAARLDDANLAAVEALAATVDAKDAYTRGHSGRVAAHAAAIAAALGLPEPDVARVRQAGLLHDVGKIGVPDAILTKPGALTDEEFEVIKQHPVVGERILQSLPFLREILPAVRHHHERWDGGGYPDGLAGNAIPADAAILAVADSFDAMTSSRTYRPALLAAEAIRRVREGAGAQYDPRVVAAFDRALANRTLPLPPIRTGELRPLPPPPRADGVPSPVGAEGMRAGALRVVR